MSAILSAFAVLAGLGVVFGAALAVAGRVFAVEEDPRLGPLTDALPGANCGGCGYSGCAAYAQAVLQGEAAPGGCPVGGAATAQAMADILGVRADDPAPRQVALVRCTGGGFAHLHCTCEGVSDCLSAARLPGGGPLGCASGCLGLGSCVRVCPFDAIHVVDRVAVVNEDKCRACGKCVEICPKGLIVLVPAQRAVTIPCASADKGVVTRKVCDTGCIGCGLCVKTCPQKAVSVEHFHAVIRYDLCVGCGACAAVCPRHIIHLRDGCAAVSAAPAGEDA